MTHRMAFPACLLAATAMTPMSDAAPATDFATWAEAFQAPGSRFQGVDAEGAPRHAGSYYRPGPGLTFDLSNNRIIASLTAQGLTQGATIVTDLQAAAMNPKSLRGVTVTKSLVASGPWDYSIQLDGEPQPTRLSQLPHVGSDLLGGVYPTFAAARGDLAIQWLAFTPEAASPRNAPRAVLQVLLLTNKGPAPRSGTVRLAGTDQVFHPGGSPLPAGARLAVYDLEGGSGGKDFPTRRFQLAPGQQAVLGYAFVLGEGPKELAATAADLQQKDALGWLNQSLALQATRMGRLSIPEAPFWSEFLTRSADLCRMAAVYLNDGRVGGTFIGSNAANTEGMWAPNVWMKDSYYQMLPMSVFDPQLCADSILFFLRWGLPPKPFGRGLKRFPHLGPEFHSFNLTLAPFLLAGNYYRMTGDKTFLQAHPELLAAARQRFEHLLAGRPDPAVFLFPSMYVSDGDARGDYHTGSNLIAWHAFDAMARLAREVYGDEATAQDWSGTAARIKADLLKHCLGDAPGGRRYFEGANADGTFVEGHDGEESDVGLRAFYGFAEADDPAAMRHARLALTPQNPLYAAGVDGIYWFDDTWFGATFPAWTTALAGAGDERALQQRLDQIARLVDLDGSIWWWPYEHGEKNPAHVLRKPVKCGWAAGVFVCRFVNDILGLRADVPAHTLSFRPFSPWKSFSWQGARLGSALIDAAYTHRDDAVSGQLVNRNSMPYTGVVELTLPAGGAVKECRINGRATSAFLSTQRYGCPAVRVEAQLQPGEALAVEILLAPH